MGSFEESMKASILTSGKDDPDATDLDFYAKPENYTGSNIQSLQRFQIAKKKQDKEANQNKNVKKKKKQGFDLFKRYRHILKGIFDGEEDEPDTSEDEEEDERGKQIENEGDGKLSSRGDISSLSNKPLTEIKEEDEETSRTPSPTINTTEAVNDIASPNSKQAMLQDSPNDMDRMSPMSELRLGSSNSSLNRKKLSMVPSGNQRQSVMLRHQMEKEVRGRIVSIKLI